MPVFEIYDNRDPRRVEVEGKRLTIGRTDDNAVVVDDRLASRVHCEILLGGNGYVLCDLQSRNGTLVNQDPVSDPVSLHDGDEICIGDATVRFWRTPRTMNAAAKKLPQVFPQSGKGESGKAAKKGPGEPARRRGGRQRPSAPMSLSDADLVEEEGQEEVIGLADSDAGSIALAVENADDQIEFSAEVAVPRPAPTEKLTLNHILPLNADGKPAHAKGEDASEVSEAMLRLKQLLLKSFQFGATDIHIEPKEETIQVRYRIDGVLHPGGSMEPQITRSVYSIVKLLCNLNISKRHIMQDGSFAVQLPDRRVDIRISLAPTTLGDKMVARILDKKLTPKGLEGLGMGETIFQEVRRLVLQESSMMIVCGPTGSGKTTTVYSILQEMNRQDRNIVTVEDPVEYKLENVTQIQVNPKHDVTFSSALKSLLRQDPDVILIGEMRDEDTAQMAVQSAMTGHLVLSTLHARDSIGSIFRMLDLGVEPFLLGSALTAVLSQRLLRKLCSQCKMKVQPAIKMLCQLGLEELAHRDLYNRVGCKSCMNIGFHGRVPIFEMLAVTDQVRAAISHKPTIQQLRVAAGDWIFQTLREDAVRKIREGFSTIDEFSIIAGREG